MANEKIRKLMYMNHIPQWKLADLMGVCENTVQRMLRRELPEAKQLEIITLIESHVNEQ